MTTTTRAFLWAAVCIVVSLCGCTSGCSTKPGENGPTNGGSSERPIRVAFNTWIGYSAFFIAEQKGIFDKHGVKVETRIIDPLAEKNAALIRGDLDAMGGTMDSAVISAAGGANGKIVFLFDRSQGC